jgi:hypothetical protein
MNSSSASFGDDVAFLKANGEVIVLSDRDGHAKVVVSPTMQGRVLTSTAQGDAGASFGWINRELIAAHKVQPHINVFGGEDRFWMGPEGGQFSIFFDKGVPFDLEHWFTPPPLDTEPFVLASHSADQAEFRRSFSLTNYSGTHFHVGVTRTVHLIGGNEVWRRLGVPQKSGVNVVGYESINRVRNEGTDTWKPESGLLSIWVLGMFNPAPATTIVVPINPGLDSKMGKEVTSDYFGRVPGDRLTVKDNTVFFRGDGKFRSKIGINPLRSKGVMGSYDPAGKVLTIVQFNVPKGQTNYVNSKWEIQSNPYAGDLANSYNDGSPAPGAKPLGPFYEMESSSPAAALEAGQIIEHTHRTLHLTGSEQDLDPVARTVLGVSLGEIVSALP